MIKFIVIARRKACKTVFVDDFACSMRVAGDR